MADDTFIISRLYKGDEDAFRYIFDNEYGLMCSFPTGCSTTGPWLKALLTT